MDLSDFDQVVEQQHRALVEFWRGNYEPAAKLWSRRDVITLGNPFGPFARGYEQILPAMQHAASLYRDGEAVGFDLVAKEVTAEFAYLVEVERLRAKMGGSEEVTPVELRSQASFGTTTARGGSCIVTRIRSRPLGRRTQ
jgi:hypothetical protein